MSKGEGWGLSPDVAKLLKMPSRVCPFDWGSGGCDAMKAAAGMHIRFLMPASSRDDAKMAIVGTGIPWGAAGVVFG